MTACDAIRRSSVRVPGGRKPPWRPSSSTTRSPHIIRGAPKWGKAEGPQGRWGMFVRLHEGAGYENGSSVREYAIVSKEGCGR